jgi:Lrp/AsnC family leucine-responsive transcriptional regulator
MSQNTTTKIAAIARIPRPAAGLPLTAFIQLNCHPGRYLLKTSAAENFPEIVEIHRLCGSSCTMVKVRTASLAHLSSLLERIGEHADANSHIVLETPLEHRTLQIPPPHPRPPAIRAGTPNRPCHRAMTVPGAAQSPDLRAR